MFIALARMHIWHARNCMNSAHKLDLTNFDKDFLETLQDVVCYAAWYSHIVQSRVLML
jgi:hypothetical protein